MRLVLEVNLVIALGKFIVLVIHLLSCDFFFLLFPPYLAYDIAMFSFSGLNGHGSEFISPPPFPVKPYVGE